MSNCLTPCPDCGVEPGAIHLEGCDVERCSQCGGQHSACACMGHDAAFARWSGIWPGLAESDYLGIDLNECIRRKLHKIFYVKPQV